MRRTVLFTLLASTLMVLAGSCHREPDIRYLVISEAVRFELQPGADALNLPMFAGTMGMEKIVRDVSQAEYYYQKLSSVYGAKSFRFMADSTVELLLDRTGQLSSPQAVYGFDDNDSRIDLSLVSFENNTAHYAFRVTDKPTGQVRNHTVDVPVGQSASIGMLFDPKQNRGQLVCIALQALALGKELTPVQLADFLRAKNTPRGVTSSSGYRPADQRWMDDIFGVKGIRLPLDTLAPAKEEEFQPFDTAPTPIENMIDFSEHFKYPASAKRDSIEGRVLIKVRIDSNGAVLNCEVTRGVRGDLDSAAVLAIHDVRFKPAVYQGKHVASTVTIPIAFKLK
jgi:TonB family protein